MVWSGFVRHEVTTIYEGWWLMVKDQRDKMVAVRTCLQSGWSKVCLDRCHILTDITGNEITWDQLMVLPWGWSETANRCEEMQNQL